MLFWTIAVCVFMGIILPHLVNSTVRYTFKADSSELTLREEYGKLKKDLASISVVDEFARYAKTQRRLNKIEGQLISAGQNRLEGREAVRWKLTKAIQAVNGAFLVYIAYFYRHQPVLQEIPDWFWPIKTFLSYPTGVDGALSTVAWLFLCNNAIRCLIK